MKTIVWHMNHRGFFLKSGNIDIKLFHQVLEEIVGNISDVVLDEVYNSLKRHYPNVSETQIAANNNMMDHGSDKHHTSSADAVIQQIQNLLEAEIGDGK